ncbi:MAG: hypothetical protein HYV63_00810 [Candidatus Schekmanbacteria bacterium]|nr:hypothetical protein [Candidatus Schekmanbacteria bacterium]
MMRNREQKERTWILPALLAVLLCGACNRKTLSIFFDVPPPPPTPTATPAPPETAAGGGAPGIGGAAWAPTPTPTPPAIEKTLAWSEARPQLPLDALGEVAWDTALREGVIRPRKDVGKPARDDDFLFGFDFFFPGPDPLFDAFFPHSVHTRWLACSSCHPAIFPVRGTRFSMADVAAGEYCGRCHGKVAFPLSSGCSKCHTKVPAFKSHTPRSKGVYGDIEFTAHDQTAPVPPAYFPHWLHRIRFRCSACHPDTFEMRKGANPIKMTEIQKGRYCGKCHNGSVAFAVAFDTCYRCHKPAQERE